MPKNLLSSANSNSTREKILGPDMLLDCYYVHSTSFKVTTTMHHNSLAQDGTGLDYVLRGDILAVEVESCLAWPRLLASKATTYIRTYNIAAC